MREIEHLVRFSLGFILLITTFVSAQVYPDSLVDKYLNVGINSILEQNYTQAEEQFNQLKIDYPNLPFGNIYLAATEIAKSLDYYQPFAEDSIFSYLDSAMEISEKRYDENDTLIWNLYFKALSEGYYAYFQAMRHNYFSAFTKGLNSINDYQKCLEYDPNFYESYVTIGTFNYWSSSKTLGLSWLPFANDNVAESIKMLEDVITKPVYNKYLAAYSLCWIYIDIKKPRKTVKLAKSILKTYPNSRLFTWVLADAYKRFDKEKAVENYWKVLNSFENNSNHLIVVKIVLMHKIAMLQFDLKEYDKSIELCNQILINDTNLNDTQLDFIEKRLERVKTLKENILEKIKK